MKKKLRSPLSLVFVAALLLALCLPAFACEGQKLTNVNESYKLVRDTELVSVYDATLYADGKTGESVYYIVCKGLDFTEFDPSQPRSYANCIRVALSDENNSYVKTIAKIVKTNIPEGSKLVFVGHSLGGMVIQQAIAREEIKDKYEILYTLSIGSPYILTSGTKEGTLRRMVDRLDPVPYLSIPLLANPCIGGACLETSFQTPLVHFRSYEKGSCWAKYDALGNKNGNAYVVLHELIYS